MTFHLAVAIPEIIAGEIRANFPEDETHFSLSLAIYIGRNAPGSENIVTHIFNSVSRKTRDFAPPAGGKIH